MHALRWTSRLTGAVLMALCAQSVLSQPATVDSSSGLDRVLALSEARNGPLALAADRGATGLWQHLLRLRTTASALYTAAHPDDEQGGVLAYLGRGQGVRTAMATLNRGEAGANAIGPELFDGLGLIRTEELLVADRYYGLDDQYFTNLIDYGYSKNLDEALRQWGRENVLRDLVRIIRINRPLVVISRFYGGPQDGHGNHEASGAVTPEAFAAAGDASKFPEQIRDEGLRPWQPLKVYRGNLRSRRSAGTGSSPPDHPWHIAVNSGVYSPWLGESYEQYAALGLSLQRSQTSGRRRERAGAYRHHFERLDSRVTAPERESSFFDGIDTSVTGIFRLAACPEPDGMPDTLATIERQLQDAAAAYSVRNPAAAVPFLAQGLALTRKAISMARECDDALFLLAVKERQFQAAINTALGIQLRAFSSPSGSEGPASPFAPLPTMGAVVPGQRFQVDTSLINSSSLPIQVQRVELAGTEAWRVEGGSLPQGSLRSGSGMAARFAVETPPDATLSRRYFYRDSVRDSRYSIRDARPLHLAGRPPALSAVADYTVGGQTVRVRSPVYRREANLPYGYEHRELKIVPALAVNVSPSNLMAPMGRARNQLTINVELVNNQPGGIRGTLAPELPDGWRARPAEQPFEFSEAGSRKNFRFSVSTPRLEDGAVDLRIVAKAAGDEFREGYRAISHRGNDIRYLYRDATTSVRGIDVEIAPGLRVGYVMGVGDEVPGGIEQLGAEVTLLGAEHLASGQLDSYAAIVIGTRAYAVRQDLINHNHRLLDYARAGGNLIVLYQTQEFVPSRWAAYPADLPRRAEEVSEEDSPVRILVPDHPVLRRPNRITEADFDGWVEQRGSKFFSSWDDAYQALIETQDQGQEPQRGGWLTAPFGEGHYTYFAYAVHRQVPYSVPGMYRIFANVLSLGR